MNKKALQNLFTGVKIAQSLAQGNGKLLDAGVALSTLFSRRFSDEEDLTSSLQSQVYCMRDDLPALSIREEVRFPSSGHSLQGYLYRTSASSSKGLVIYVHGIKGQADDLYANGQAWFVRHGYDVFSFDLTASGRSEGLGIDGLHQSAVDVANAVSYVASRRDLKKMPRFLFGHSWGGFGVMGSTYFRHDVQAIAAVSGFASPLQEMMGVPKEWTGMSMEFSREDLEKALRNRAGELADLDAAGSAISSGVPLLVAHGGKDRTVPLKASLYEHLGDHAKRLFYPEKGHMDILFDARSSEYAKTAMDMAKDFAKRHGKDVQKWPMNVKAEFKGFHDKRMASVVNEELFEEVDRFFLAKR